MYEDRLYKVFRYATDTDFEYVLSVLQKAVRHNEDMQTKFWIAVIKEAKVELDHQNGK